MGKVGTSAISTSMQKAGLPVHHTHTLDETRLLESTKNSIQRGKFPAPHVCESMGWKRRLFSHPDKCLYITLVRDPIARNLSAFFENIENFLGSDFVKRRPETILKTFFEKYNHTAPLTWFDQELQAQLGKDAFQTPFDKAQRYISLRNSKALIFRADCDDLVVARVLSKALCKKITIEPENVSASKSHDETYEKVKAFSKFPAEFLDALYDTDYVRQFWPEDEVNSFRHQWQTSDGT